MPVEEYNALMEAKGTPKVWVVEYGWGGGMIQTDLFLTEEEAKVKYDSLPEDWYRNMCQTWDIWGWTGRQKGGKEGNYA